MVVLLRPDSPGSLRLTFAELARRLPRSFPDDYRPAVDHVLWLMRHVVVADGRYRGVVITFDRKSAYVEQSQVGLLQRLVAVLADDKSRLPFNQLLPVECPLRLSAADGVGYVNGVRVKSLLGAYSVWFSWKEFGVEESDLTVIPYPGYSAVCRALADDCN